MPTVILLKSPNTEKDTVDLYQTALSLRGYDCRFIPVLEHGFANESSLDDTLSRGARDVYSGVIVTSGRTVEAWGESARRVLGTGPYDGSGWNSIPFYAVGPNTAASLRALSETYQLDSALCPSLVLGGEESGTGERLAHFIVSDMSERKTNMAALPLLYLTGDKASNTIPDVLHCAKLSVNSLRVYETRPTSSFKNDFEAMLELLRGRETEVSWIVFFSPSGCRIALPSVREHYSLPPDPESAVDSGSVRLAAIGPTTTSFLRQDCGLRVDAIPLKPDPEALAIVISNFDLQRH